MLSRDYVATRLTHDLTQAGEIVGYKPSRGKISNQGLVRLAEDFDSVGLLTTSVSDLITILSAIQNVAYSPIDPSTLQIVGSQLSKDADSLGQSAVEQVLSKIANLSERTIEGFDAGAVRRAGLLVCELEGSESLGLDGSTTQHGFSEEFLSTMKFVHTLPPTKIAETKVKIAEFQGRMRTLFKTFDVMILPTTPAGAPALSANPPTAADLTAWVNISGLSSLSIVEPTTRRSVQLVGASDENVLRLGLWLEKEFSTSH
ncbi:MAG: hypothetical protein EBU43_00620 [Actinobacteria bacterium]|nr:hypothetical protein [Actinomycetota bacterium]